MGCIVILISTLSGLVGGFFGGYMGRLFAFTPTIEGQAVAGGLFGAVVGVICGNLGSDPNKAAGGGAAGSSGMRFMIAFVSGGIAGAIGGSRFEIIWELLRRFGVQVSM